MTSPEAEGDESMRTFATGFFADACDFAAGWDAYREPQARGAYSDLLSIDDLAGLLPTIVLNGEADAVRIQSERFAERLSRADVPVVLLRARGSIHAA